MTNIIQRNAMNVGKYVLLGSVMAVLSGCAASYSDSGTFIPSPKDVGNMLFTKKASPDEILAQSKDKDLTKAFLDQKIDKVTSIDPLPYGLLLECKRLYETDSFIYLSKSRQFYRNLAADFLNDTIAKTYMDTIKKRGNGYVIYNGEGNQILLKAYVGGNLKQNTKTEIYMYDSDFAIVEYNKAGEKISAMIRQARIEPSQLGSAMGHNDPAVTIHQNIFVLFESELKKIALNLNTTALQGNVYKSEGVAIPGSNATTTTAQPTQSTSDSKTDKIKELHELYKSGALTEEEYAKEKSKILNTETQKPSAPPASSSNAMAAGMEAMVVQKFNQQNGTNFSSMKEIQEFLNAKKQ